MQHKKSLRLSLGQHLTILFESPWTVAHHIQEVLWVEGIDDLARVKATAAEYLSLCPTPGRLTATVFIDGGKPHEAGALSRSLADSPQGLVLEVGPLKIQAHSLEPQGGSEGPVHYVGFSVHAMAMLMLTHPNLECALSFWFGDKDAGDGARRTSLAMGTRLALAQTWLDGGDHHWQGAKQWTMVGRSSWPNIANTKWEPMTA